MNTAKNLIPSLPAASVLPGVPTVSADTPVVDLLPLLLESPNHTLSVTEGDRSMGVLTESLLLEGLSRQYVRRDDCSIVTVVCPTADYSASRLATAVEDAGFHLLDLWSVPRGERDEVEVSLRIRCQDPTSAVHSLERYGYEVAEVHAQNSYADAERAAERLLALQAYLNV